MVVFPTAGVPVIKMIRLIFLTFLFGYPLTVILILMN